MTHRIVTPAAPVQPRRPVPRSRRLTRAQAAEVRAELSGLMAELAALGVRVTALEREARPAGVACLAA